MIRSPFVNFIFGSIFGGMLAITVTLHVATKQVEARDAKISDLWNDAYQHTNHKWQEAVDLWKTRADKCEAKDRNLTLIYEYRPGASIPLLNGVFGITLGTEKNHPDSDVKPVWAIPAQVKVYSYVPGGSYEWIDGKTGSSIGRFPAVPPPSPSVPQ